MSIYYKFKSGKEFHSIPTLSPFMSVLEIKDLIFQTKKFGHGKDFGLILTNPSTNEDYKDDSTLIPRNSSVIVRRIPGLPGKTIVFKSKEQEEKDKEDEKIKEICQQTISYVNANNGTAAVNSAHQRVSAMVIWVEGQQWGKEVVWIGGYHQRVTLVIDAKVPGHYIQHCPTNGDPDYDVKKLRPPTGIPKSMLVETADGSYALPGGSVAKLVEGIPTISRRVIDIPPELHCPMCKDVMRFAVLTSKCCFQSFCDGSRGILVDDLIPNKTIRDTMDRYIASVNTSSGNTKSTISNEDVGCAHSSLPKIPVPNQAHENGQFAPSLDLSEDEAESTSSKVINSAALGQRKCNRSILLVRTRKWRNPSSLLMASRFQMKTCFWGTSQANGADYCQMPFGTSAYNNPYWNGMQLGMDGSGPYGGMFTQNQNPFGGCSGYELPYAASQMKKRSRVAPCQGNDWGHDDEERNYKKKQSWHTSFCFVSRKVEEAKLFSMLQKLEKHVNF
ncbi:hypothetical protein MKW92_024343 [Papaver armeniacum]|nr:hypothetical protein MKW92_024343 [Papaver armeniacum]